MEMHATLDRPATPDKATPPYARCIEASRRVRWEIDAHVIRGRRFDTSRKFLPDGLSKVRDLPFLSAEEARFLSQIQGRTYANVFGLVERYIGLKTLDLAKAHGAGDQVAVEALVRMTDEELKHQELFRRLERMAASAMPSGYRFTADPNAVASAVLSKSTWAVLALTLDIEIFTQVHYRSSIESDQDLCPLWKDVFLFHWKEESQHAILDELEWRAEDAKVEAAARDRAVDDLVALVGAVDGIVCAQARADAEYFVLRAGRTFSSSETKAVADALRKAYRRQYVASGASEPRFAGVLEELLSPRQRERVGAALAPILADAA